LAESFLERVTAARRADAQRRRNHGALDLAKKAAAAAGAPRDFAAALAAPGLSLIGEVKRASPSAGTIAGNADPVALARAYERGGAAAVSVLTEPDHFRGSIDDLRAVRDAVSLPALRKDFLCDALHVWEARAAGADAVLLIVAALEQTELVALLDLSETLGMAALVEAHTADEVDRALRAGARIVGLNTRDLQTLEVDVGVVKELRPLVPASALVVAESGIASRADVEAVESLDVDAVLVGEALMRAPDPAAAVRSLLGKED
jgi:indole-3-glycerol phosphate synthase